VEKYGGARQATDENIIRRMRFACWVTKATDTCSWNVITAFPRQQWLRERASLLRTRTLPLLFYQNKAFSKCARKLQHTNIKTFLSAAAQICRSYEETYEKKTPNTLRIFQTKVKDIVMS
jgi:hypothetical protein